MAKILDINLERIKKICRRRHVIELYSFGSINTDEFNTNSDIDLLVEFGPLEIENYADNYFDLIEDLEDLFQRKVDLVTVKSVKNPYFKKELNKTRQLIFAA